MSPGRCAYGSRRWHPEWLRRLARALAARGETEGFSTSLRPLACSLLGGQHRRGLAGPISALCRVDRLISGSSTRRLNKGQRIALRAEGEVVGGLEAARGAGDHGLGPLGSRIHTRALTVASPSMPIPTDVMSGREQALPEHRRRDAELHHAPRPE